MSGLMSGLLRGERQLHLLSTLSVFCSHQSGMKGREINMGDNKAVCHSRKDTRLGNRRATFE